MRIDIAGTVASIANITKEPVLCYETFYHPATWSCSSSAALTTENIMQLVRDNQAAKPFEMKGEIKRFYPQETGDIHQSLNEVQLPVGISKCLMGFKEEKSALQGDDFLKREFATQIALEALFGQSSDLYQRLYDDGLIDDQFGFDYVLEHGYGFSMFGGDTKTRTP